MSTPTLILCAVVVGLVLLFVLRRVLLKLVGPVLGFDAVRTARRSRLSLARACYAFVLLLVLFLVYVQEFGIDLSSGLAVLMNEQQVSSSEAAHFANRFFRVFLVAQFLTVLVLTPVFTAGAIAEERERGTLALLLASDLLDREIILGKLVSRLAHLVLLLLAGVPILSLLQLLGGVDPALLAGSFVLTLFTAVGVGALSMLCSVMCRRTRDAILFTYVWVGVYQVCSNFWGLVSGWNPDSFAEFVIGSFTTGNVALLYFHLTKLSQAGNLAAELPVLLLQNLTLHAGIVFICLSGAIAELRHSRVRRDTRLSSPQTQERPESPSERPRPPLQEQAPLLWMECHLDSNSALLVGSESQLRALGLVFGFVTVLRVFLGSLSPVGTTGGLPAFFNGVVRLFLLLVAGVALLGLALRAAGAFAGERERRTLEGLLTTDLSRHEILVGKLWGCLYQFRPLGTVLPILLVLGVLTGGVGPGWALLEVLVLTAHALFVVCLGMYCSLWCQTALRATVVTGVLLLAFGVGHWLLFVGEAALCHWLGWSEFIAPLSRFHHYGLTPPVTQFHVLVPLSGRGVESAVGWSAYLAIHWYSFLAAVLWGLLHFHFTHLTGRR